MVNWAISTAHMLDLPKRFLAIGSYSRIAIIMKTKYMENVPTTLFIPSTDRTKVFTALGIFAPFFWCPYPYRFLK
jgi:hypothetical protein